MLYYNCSTPSYPLIGSGRVFYVISCTTIIILSIVLQTIFAMICQKMKGWRSDFAFYLLQIMAIFSLLSYIGLLVSYIDGLILFDSPVLFRITGSNYQGSFFGFVIANLFLTTHRLFYTLLPLRAQFILTSRVAKLSMAFIFTFFVAYMTITLTPLASVQLCMAHFFFYFGKAPLYPVISSINQLSNYVIGIVNVTAYTIMFTTMFVKGTLTFKRNSEIRMTVQERENRDEVSFPQNPTPQHRLWSRLIDHQNHMAYNGKVFEIAG